MSDKQIPLLEEVMTVDTLAIAASCSLVIAEQMMSNGDVRHLAVTDESGPIGIISEQDLLRISLPAHPIDDDGLLVSDLLRSHHYMADISDPLDRVLDIMVSDGIDAILVLNEGELAGIFTSTDACKLLAGILKEYN